MQKDYLYSIMEALVQIQDQLKAHLFTVTMLERCFDDLPDPNYDYRERVELTSRSCQMTALYVSKNLGAVISSLDRMLLTDRE